MVWREAVAAKRTSEYPSMEEMVAPYVAEISAHVRSTPCVLAGFCYAGRIAFEAAHQLHKLGGKVEAVILIDTQARPVNRYKLAWQIWRQDWKQPESGASQDGVARSLGARMRNAWHTTGWLAGKVGKRLKSYLRPPEDDLSTLSGVLDEQGMPLPWGLLDRLYAVIDRPEDLRRLNCRGILLRTGELDGKQVAYEADDAWGWEDLFAGGVEAIPIAGHHFSIWGRQIPTIAKEINRGLRQLDHGERAGARDGKPVQISLEESLDEASPGGLPTT
jgi:thioesterase domain-containing protein